jgi:hypothetical protein
MASVTVSMGEIAWLNKSTGEYSLRKSKQDSSHIDGQIFEDRYGLYTDGLSSCFALAVIGPGGAILAHVPAYFGHDNLPEEEVNEVKVMMENFCVIWGTNWKALTPSTVVKVMGEHTKKDKMEQLMNHMFDQVALAPDMVFSCDKLPKPRKERHGEVVVVTEPDGNEVFVEDKKVL